ncbi:SDR family NAD(P)-dependent oxidoreductase [Peptococcus simiae]|uniref:SDR family NAD(P)-dependent oxidoreductase n=1 Tax=Peptococcus simiae TaxID=1643805 RepID=A0ABW9GZY9_9FIRM
MEFQFKNKTVVVTGASSGMGYAIAQSFVKEGATVIAVARRAERLEELKESLKDASGVLVPVTADLAVDENNSLMVETAVKEGGRIDVLINNAGMMDEFMPIGEVDDALWDKVFKINLDSPRHAMKAAVNHMLSDGKGGVIINIASIGGLEGCRAGAAYTASKHALVGLTKNTAYMYAHDNIRCLAICPGGVKTEVGKYASHPSEKGIQRVMSGLDANIRQADVQEIADLVLFMASEKADFVNGTAITVDGGVSAN